VPAPLFFLIVVSDTPPQPLAARDRAAIRPAYGRRPSGLRAGSPPFPPPRLIRPTVRLLLRSPRFWVRVPISCITQSMTSVRQNVRWKRLIGICKGIRVLLNRCGDPGMGELKQQRATCSQENCGLPVDTPGHRSRTEVACK